jgi:hypothetical protein
MITTAPCLHPYPHNPGVSHSVTAWSLNYAKTLGDGPSISGRAASLSVHRLTRNQADVTRTRPDPPQVVAQPVLRLRIDLYLMPGIAPAGTPPARTPRAAPDVSGLPRAAWRFLVVVQDDPLIAIASLDGPGPCVIVSGT